MIPVEQQAISEPRIKRLAVDLRIPRHHALGCLVEVWSVCYERLDAIIRVIDVDTAAELEGFAAAMIVHGLADRVDDPSFIRIRGVERHLSAKIKKAEGGIRSGESRRKKRDELQKRRVFEESSKSVRRPFELARDHASARRSPEIFTSKEKSDPAESTDSHRVDETVTTSTKSARFFGSGATAVQINDVGTRSDLALCARLGHLDGQNERAGGRREPSLEAQRLAGLMMTSVVTNHPTHKLATGSDGVAQRTILNWSDTFDAMSRLDHIEWEDIAVMITWSQSEPFWRSRILGPDLLRKHWHTMQAQRAQSARKGPAAAAVRELEAMQADEKEAG